MKKSLTKAMVKQRYEKSAIKPIVELYEFKHKINSIDEYDRLLKIVIPGHPLNDDRVRTNTKTNAHYNPELASMRKVFSEVYNGSILEKICIIGQMRVVLKIYRPVVKKYVKFFTDDESKKLDDEKLYCFDRPDNDNYEKIHFDVLQDDHFMVLLRDEEIVSNYTEKYFVRDPAQARSELYIYFKSEVNTWFWEHSVLPSTSYLKFTCSPKYFRIINAPENTWKDLFYSTLKEWRIKYKKDLLRTMRPFIKKLPTDVLRLLGEQSNAEKNINKIIKNIERIQKLT